MEATLMDHYPSAARVSLALSCQGGVDAPMQHSALEFLDRPPFKPCEGGDRLYSMNQKARFIIKTAVPKKGTL